MSFSGGSLVSNPPAGDPGWIPDLGRSHVLWGTTTIEPEL